MNRVSTWRSTYWISANIMVALLVAACGSSSFEGGLAGQSGTHHTSPPTAKPTLTPGANQIPTDTALTSLNWYWPCASDAGTAPTANGTDAVLLDGGDHNLSQANFAKDVPLTISGRVCPPTKLPRDIVFVIDVSGSMGDQFLQPGNDPAKSNSCGRLNAVNKIIADVTSQGSDARFGIVTFSSGKNGDATAANAKSSAMFADAKTLMADVDAASDPAKVLCQADSGTNYSIGLSTAEELLKTSRSGATKEIYFISDGQPDKGSEGRDIAARLKTSGVSIKGTSAPVQIAAVMLGSDTGAELKNYTASKQTDGTPLFAIASDASQLSSTLSKLAANDIDNGTVKYRAIGTTAWTEVSLKDQIKDYNFALAPFTVNATTNPNGLEVSFEYRDLHTNVFSNGGTIKWPAKP